jgi:guanosine-3',5'-bis(diphosphate) 3'-pyrophosphohydrolase
LSSAQSALKPILRALAFAAHKHRDQRRKDAGASPYINHPIALTDILCNEAGIDDPDILCAALLHDTVEDTDTTPEELETLFGPRVRALVMDVTDDKRLPKAERKRLQIERAGILSRGAQLVKLADKIANLRDVANCPPESWSLEQRQKYFDWAKAVADRLRGVHPLLEALFDAAYAQRPPE